MSSSDQEKNWRFLSNHTQVLLCLAHNSDIRMRDLGDAVGITERAAQRIVTDLIESDYVHRERVGRRNRYTVNPRAMMRHPAQRDQEIGELLAVLKFADSE